MYTHVEAPNYSRMALMYLSAIHFGLAFLLESYPFVATLYGVLPTIITLGLVVLRRNRDNEALLGSAYIMGAEIIWRITQGYASYEFAKHSISLILLVGVMVERQHRSWDKRLLIYFISFIPSTLIALDVIPDQERFRQLSAILSGPLCLISAIFYFSNRAINLGTFIKTFQWFAATTITLISILFISNPDLEAITYIAQSNFATSGGFGPNQVSTILGLGILVVSIFIWTGKRLTGFLVTDSVLLAFLVFRGFLTFSRGGMLAAFISLSAFIIVFSLYRWKSGGYAIRLIALTVGGLIMVTIIWSKLTDITEGQIVNRYTGKDTRGNPVKDFSTGRAAIGADEIISFQESPVIGVGLSYSKFLRSEKTGTFVNTHDEFTRTLAEQGLLGVAGLLSVFAIAFHNYKRRNSFNKAVFWAFIMIFTATLLHSAMRLSMVGLIFGIALAVIVPDRIPDTRRRVPLAAA